MFLKYFLSVFISSSTSTIFSSTPSSFFFFFLSLPATSPVPL
jgi:hypothetical protein